MSKRIVSVLLVLILVVGGALSTFAGTNPEGSVPDGEDINGFKPGVYTQYYDVYGLTSIGDRPVWEDLDLDDAPMSGSLIITNGAHTPGGTYTSHKSSLNSFFHAIQYDRDATKDAFRHEGYLYLNAGTTPMKITSDDGVILRMDLVNPNSGAGISYATLVDEWYPHSAKTNSFSATVATDGYYRYQMDFFNWGGDGVLRWQVAPTISNAPSVEASATSNGFTDIDSSRFYRYEAPSYLLTVEIIGNGSVVNTPTSETGKYLTGTPVGLVPTAAEGWSFAGFSENVVDGSILMNSDKTVVATFTQNPPPPAPSPTPAPVQVPLTVSVEGPGTAWPEGTSSFSQNSVVVMNVVPDEDAVFEGWFGENGSEVNSSNGIAMNASKSVIARFKANEEAVVVVDDPIPEVAPTPEVLIDPAPVEEPEQIEESTVSEEILTEETVPQDAPELPQTGGIPMLLLSSMGVLMTSGGLFLNRRKKKDEE